MWTTQNDFVYGKLGRTDYQSRRFIAIIKYWLKVISSDETKYIKQRSGIKKPVSVPHSDFLKNPYK